MTTTPRGLKARGRRLWASVTDDFDLDASAAAVLEQACYTIDELTEMRAKQAEIELVIESSQGPRVHPLYQEVRARSLLFAKLIRDIGLPKALADEYGDDAADA